MAAFQNWQTYLNTRVKIFRDTAKLNQFAQLKTDFSRIKYIVENAPLSDATWITKYFESRQKPSAPDKNEGTAKAYRQEGNSYYVNKRNEAALKCYNQCVSCAPAESEEFTLGVANRSAVLFHMQKYKECIADIEIALKRGHLQLFKLRLRESRALAKLGRIQQATELLEAFMADEVWASYAEQSKRDFAKKEVTKMLSELRGMNGEKEKIASAANISTTRSLPFLEGGPHPVVSQASNNISLERSSSQGRHLRAASDISEGDVLIVEKPYASVLLPPYYATHCQNCYGKLLSGVPCPHCHNAMFCSVECQKEAAQYHRIECHYMDLLESIGIAHLSMRIVLTAGLEHLKVSVWSPAYRKQDKPARKPDVIPGITADGTYSRSYLAVYKLMPHTKDLLPADMLQYTLTACLLLELLRYASFFPDEDASYDYTLSATELHIGSLLLRHVCQLVCNAHAITEVQRKLSIEGILDDMEQVKIATAIYPTVSLMNHSCDPSVIASFDLNVLVIRAVKDIKKGEQIYNCYGPHCKRMNYRERQRALREQYFFDCECEACQRHGEEELHFRALKCPACSGALPVIKHDSACLDCGKTFPVADKLKIVMQAEKLFVAGLHRLEQKDTKGALRNFEECLRQREEIMYKHNRQLAECQDSVARCLAALGRFGESLKFLEKSIVTSEAVYGERSIEVANELRKLADILFHLKRYDRLMATLDRAKRIFTKNYGPKHETVMEVQDSLQKAYKLSVSRR